MWSSTLVAVIILLSSREILEDGIIEEGIIYNADLIKWEDIISCEWQRSNLKMIVFRKYLGFKLEDEITIQVKNDTVWKKYINRDKPFV